GVCSSRRTANLISRVPANVSHKTCRTCGSSLDLEAPSGFCPACLFQTALNPEGEEAESAGARFTDFEIVEEVARGGMGIVYRARQNHPNRVVALKMILPSHVSSHDAVARFRAEAEPAAGAKLTSAADIYSLGAILFHLLTGRPPFRGDHAVEVLRKAAEQPPPMPRSIDPRIPRDLQTICLKCLEKDPSQRYASAAA